MFLRKMGRRVLILHSYRDGRGKVCQQRLGHFVDAPGLERHLASLPQRCPDIHLDAIKLRAQAKRLLSDAAQPAAAEERAQRIQRATRRLLNYLAEEEDPEVLLEAKPDLELLQAHLGEPGKEEQADLRRTRSQLSPRRRRFDSGESKAQDYLEALEGLAGRLSFPDHVELLAEAARAHPTADSRLAYGAALQKLGRPDEALKQYGRVPNCYSYRYFNSAAACWQQERPDEALVHLLRGFLLESQVVDALQRLQKGKVPLRGGGYWEEFGELWPAEARSFACAVCAEQLVRFRLNKAFERKVLVRQLVPASSRVWLLERGLAAARARK